MTKEFGDNPSGEDKVRVLVEVRVEKGTNAAFALSAARAAAVPGFQLDTSYQPVPVSPAPNLRASLEAARQETVIVRGTIEEGKIKELEAQPNVIKVWKDTRIAPFYREAGERKYLLVPTSPMSPCPLPPCDCTFGNPAIGTMADVARYLGVDQIWAAGYKGEGIAIGIVDGGITAIGRTPQPGETAKIKNVVDGWPSDWGTTASAWGDHGNMTSTDALGMAPNAQIYDIRISDGETISSALSGFQWAIEKHRATGKPQILSNSWGIFEESWDPDYARDPDHPFTRKVVDALEEGILVLFAAGNCGQTCPDGRCRADNGPGKSIWGANGHPDVITVGAANLREQWVGYSSQGPAALDPQKPDFCSITHFQGYFPTQNPRGASDGGTSAATPIASGVVALFKQALPALTQARAKEVLKQTAKNIGPAGWDQHSGSGIIQAKAAYDLLKPAEPEDKCGKYEPYLKYVLYFAYRKPSLQVCLCYYVCGMGDKPRCSALEMAITKRVTNALNLCPHLKEEFCRSLRCRGAAPSLLAPGEAVTAEEEMAQAELELMALEVVSAPEEVAFEGFVEAAAELESAPLIAREEEMLRAERELAAARAELQCQSYVPYLKSVIAAASANPMLKACLCHYVCGIGPRPFCARVHIDVVRRVISILKSCPEYRSPFCRGLRCP